MKWLAPRDSRSDRRVLQHDHAVVQVFQKLGQPVPESNLVVDEKEIKRATGAAEDAGPVLVVEDW